MKNKKYIYKKTDAELLSKLDVFISLRGIKELFSLIAHVCNEKAKYYSKTKNRLKSATCKKAGETILSMSESFYLFSKLPED